MTRLSIVAVLALAAALGVQTVRLAQEQKSSAQAAQAWAEERSRASEAARLASEAFRRQELAASEQSVEAEYGHQRKAAAAASAASGGGDAVRRLRDKVADLSSARDRAVSGATSCTAQLEDAAGRADRYRVEAERAGQALVQCASAHRDLAEYADAVELKLDLALRYIEVVAPRAGPAVIP